MKRILILLIIVFTQNIFSHEQHAHQLITLEAYNLLKLYFGSDITVMQNHLGSQIGFAGDGPWTTGLILSGAWREDNEDVVYHYSNSNPPTVTGPDGALANAVLFFGDLFNNSNEAYSSVTHFWEPDDGDALSTTIQVYKVGMNYQFTVPNAYQKIKAYANGNWELLGNTDWLFYYNGKKAKLQDLQGQTFRRIYYNNIIDLYKNGTVKIKNMAYAYYYLQNEDGSVVPYIPDNSGTITLRLNDDVKNLIVWEILGRMCHLLQDMTIPSHVHDDAHGKPDDGIREDPYETSFGEIQWTAQQVNANVGGIFDINSINDPIHYLMFSNSQMSDHFAGAGPYSTRIDDIIEGNYTTQEYNYLSSLNLSTWGEPATFSTTLTTDQLTNIRNRLIPQAVRSTATLLYWFAKEAGILPTPLVSVNLNGVSELFAEMTGHWYTTLTNGIAPFNYSWEMKFVGNELLASQQVLSSSIIKPYLPPSNYWIPTGTNSPYYSTTQNPNDIRDFYLRCTVTDNTNTTKISNEFYVIVSPDPPPLGKETASNNKVQTKLIEEKEIKDNSLGNYPNPFNPSTMITYSLKERDHVTLIVYDFLGKEVARLVDGIQTEGEHSVVFSAKGGFASGGNGSNLPSGIYVYKLTGRNFNISKKMLLLK